MKIGVPREIHQNECRVALTPDTAARMQKLGYECTIESGAGAAASFGDGAYRDAGVEVIAERAELRLSGRNLLDAAHPMSADARSVLAPGRTMVATLVWRPGPPYAPESPSPPELPSPLTRSRPPPPPPPQAAPSATRPSG